MTKCHVSFAKVCMLFCILVSIVPMLGGCAFDYTYDRVVGVTQACYAIPGCYTSDKHASRVKFIEKDQYNRKLFAIRISGINAIMISQKCDERLVYYYDNVSYACTKEYAKYTYSEIEELKDKNDWGKELNVDKMICRVLNSAHDLMPQMNLSNLSNFGNILEYTNADRIFEHNVCIPDGWAYYINVCDKSVTDQELYIGTLYKKNDGSEQAGVHDRKHYLMIINADGTYDPDTFIVEFDDINKSNEPLAKVKAMNGWIG